MLKNRMVKLCVTYRSQLLNVAIALGGMWVGLLFVANVFDYAGVEDAYVTTTPDGHRLMSDGKAAIAVDEKGNALLQDESSSVDYWKIFAVGSIPLTVAAMGLYGHHARNAPSAIDISSHSTGALNRVVSSKASYSKELFEAWMDGLARSEAVCSSLKQLRRSMNGPFVDSVKSAYDTAAKTHNHNVNKFMYFVPILKLKNDNNPSIMSATEELAIDVAAMEDLLSTCSHLYTASAISEPHTKIIATEVESIEHRLQALREIDDRMLMPAKIVEDAVTAEACTEDR